MLKKISLQYLCIVILFLVGCHNEPYEGEIIIEDNSCLLAMQATADAAVNFSSTTENNYSVLCKVYRGALEDQIEICGDEDSSLQTLVDALGTCVLDEDLCEEAITATEIAQEDYENATDDTLEDMCNAYVDALEYQIEVCGDDGTLQAIIDDIGDCAPVFLDLVGNWRLISWLNDQGIDIDNDGEVTFDYLEEIDCYDNETITFNGDGTGLFFYRSIAEITYTPTGPEGEDFFVDCTNISETISFTWTQNGNTVAITFSDGTTINHFRNADSLFVVVNGGFTATSTVDGTSTIVEPVTYVYEKY